MTAVMQGVRILEVAEHTFVPAASALLADWGAEVIKIEAPTGDPIRGLVSGGVGKTDGITYTWELFNRGKRGIALDLNEETAQKIVYQLAETADVFLTSLLPRARKKLKIDHDDIRAANPQIIYAVGSGQGARGPEADKGGYDSISFWSRGSVSASVTPTGQLPIGMPAGAFGDSLSGMGLAGGIAAALAHKAHTGEGGWSTARCSAPPCGRCRWGSSVPRWPASTSCRRAIARRCRIRSNTYPTSDGRWIALRMLQPDVYWADFCMAIGRKDLIDDERFDNAVVRAQHGAECVAELDKTFATKTLEEWKPLLQTQPGQWIVVNRVSDLPIRRRRRTASCRRSTTARAVSSRSSPTRCSSTASRRSSSPLEFADTDEILLTRLGLGRDHRGQGVGRRILTTMKPAPEPDDVTAFFWRGAAEGALLVLRCAACGFLSHPPDVSCARCGAAVLDPSPMSGLGSVYTFAIVRQAFDPMFLPENPPGMFYLGTRVTAGL
jgi:crotonobetainyl-CoA:carnitine CoA-transferase CaiB-like acyl-CoA transferase